MIKLLTFQTWVSQWDWFVYAQQHQMQVPFLLVDRLPCTDPFFDQYALPEERRPIISGLCRCLKNFQQGDIYIYITRVDHQVCLALGIPAGSYLGIAALIVSKVHESHADAAATFTSRRYVVAPTPTPYPPNLAHELQTRSEVLRESCIVSLGTHAHYTADYSTDAQWRQQVQFYHWRQKKRQLRAAECCVQQVGGRNVLQLNPEHAPVLTPDDWGGAQMNISGIKLQEARADHLCQLIASGR